jgi:hypothetical protein
MTRQEVKKSSDNELVRESLHTYGRLLQNWASNRGVKQLEKHWKDCTDEMVKRNILTEEDVNHLNL